MYMPKLTEKKQRELEAYKDYARSLVRRGFTHDEAGKVMNRSRVWVTNAVNEVIVDKPVDDKIT